MNKCAASADEVTTCLDFAFRSSEIIRLLRRLRDACGAEQIGETHQAVIKADLNRAIQSVMRANTEFRQNFRREEQQLTRSEDERIYKDSGRTYCNRHNFFSARDLSTLSTAGQTPREITRKADRKSTRLNSS